VSIIGRVWNTGWRFLSFVRKAPGCCCWRHILRLYRQSGERDQAKNEQKVPQKHERGPAHRIPFLAPTLRLVNQMDGPQQISTSRLWDPDGICLTRSAPLDQITKGTDAHHSRLVVSQTIVNLTRELLSLQYAVNRGLLPMADSSAAVRALFTGWPFYRRPKGVR
jgi:hypothetical protein